MSALGGLLQRLRPRRVEPAADQPLRGLVLKQMPVATYAVGDVHGCHALYRRLEGRLVEDGRRLDGRKLIVLLGDVVDRGPDSAGLIEHLIAPPPDGFDRICLMGNHEDMMLRFFENPAKNAIWLEFGGRETLISYGIRPDPDHGWNIGARRMRLVMQAHIPLEHIQFLQSLPLYVSVGGYFLVHGGIDPNKPLQHQTKDDLIWTRLASVSDTSPVEKIVVHGHTPVKTAGQVGWRIETDTNACFSGRLSAAKLTSTHPASFLTVAH